MAVGVLHALRSEGVRVPEDVSVVGFDDHPDAEAFGLTTVHQPAHDLGARLAAGLVTELVARRRLTAARPGPAAAPQLPSPAHPPRHVLSDFTRLVVRESTAAPPAYPATSSSAVTSS
jgi:DNA-binding LacI/PurR family transcriptional regulator